MALCCVLYAVVCELLHSGCVCVCVCAGVMVVIDCPSTLVYRGYMVDAVLAQTILRSKYVGPQDSAMWLGVETQVVLQVVQYTVFGPQDSGKSQDCTHTKK